MEHEPRGDGRFGGDGVRHVGMWGAVGPSNHVLDGGPDPPMVRGNFGGLLPPPLKSIVIACSRVFRLPLFSLFYAL